MDKFFIKQQLEQRSPWLSRLARNTVWRVHPVARRSRAWLTRHQGVHDGEQCVIIGNGPSLNKMDLSLLKNVKTFTLNRGYLLFERMGSDSDFHVVVNSHVVRQWQDELLRLPMDIFSSWDRRHDYDDMGRVIYIGGPSWNSNPHFSTDLRKDLWEGATVTFVALQLAYFLGFDEVYLIGVDHRFKTQGEPHKKIRSEGDDVDHFDPNYFGKGSEWQLPDLETSEIAYRLARQYFQQDGRKIYDATFDGALDVFPKIDFNQVFA